MKKKRKGYLALMMVLFMLFSQIGGGYYAFGMQAPGEEDTESPTVPTDLAAIVSGDAVTLSWTASSDNVGVDHYEVLRDGVYVADDVRDTAYTESGLEAGSYIYEVRARDAAGNASATSEEVTVVVGSASPGDTEPPAAPAGLTADVNGTSVALSWSAAIDNVGATGYQVFRDGDLIAEAVDTAYTDEGLADATYIYTVKAVDAAGNVSEASNEAGVTVSRPADYDLANDWSAVDNPNGVWSYGWISALGGAFNLSGSSGNQWWGDGGTNIWKNAGSGTAYGVAPEEVSLHPGGGGQFSVIRWTSPLEGNITVSGHFGAGDSGNMSYFIYKNGASALYTERNSYADGFFSVNQDVSSGDTLDFIVGEGYICGNTPLHARIVVNSFSPVEPVAAPAADPAGGEVAMGTAVHLSTSTAGAEIYYTIDGSEPGGSSTRYEDTEPIIINGDVTVKAVVIKNGVSSTVMTVDYTAYGEYNGHYYRIIDREINWGDASDEAENLSYNGIPGHLLTVDSQAENDFIVSLGGYDYHWLGGYQPSGSPEPDGNWHWVTGEPWTYTNWPPTEPNNAGNEYALVYTADGRWNDLWGIGVTSGYVVEFESGVVLPAVAPAPSPAEGKVARGSWVLLSTSTVGAKIHYTTDGSEPTPSSAWYLFPLTINEDTTIKAIAVMEGRPDSPVMVAAYTALDEAEVVSNDKDALEIGYSSHEDEHFVLSHVTLPTEGAYGSTVSWASSDPAIIGTDGSVTRPGEADATVTLTAALNYHEASDTKTFTLKVKKTALDYTAFGSHYYAVVHGRYTWEEAQPAAEDLNYNGIKGHLATITSQAENDFIVGLGDTSFHWLGGLQPGDTPDSEGFDGNWHWVTSESWSYTNWEEGQPDNCGGAEHYLHFHNPEGYWNDMVIDGDGVGFVVEFEAETTVAAPEASVAAGEVPVGTEVLLSTTTEDAGIYYTTDGSDPGSSNGTLYSQPIIVDDFVTIKAIALKEGMNPSPIATFVFSVPGSGLLATHYNDQGDVTWVTVDLQVNYDQTDIGYYEKVVWEGRIKAQYTEDYQISAVFGGDAGLGSNLYIYENGLPKETTGVWSNGVWVLYTTVSLQAGQTYPIAVEYSRSASGAGTCQLWWESASQDPELVPAQALLPLSHSYESVAVPTAAPPTGWVEYDTAVSLSCAIDDARIHYTVDGSEATPYSELYTDPIVINDTTTIKAVAVKDGMLISPVLTADYFIAGDEEFLRLDKAALQIGFAPGDTAESVTSDLVLADTGVYGSSITWESSDESIIGTDGTVNRPEAGDRLISLIAHLDKNGCTDDKVFYLTVLQNQAEFYEYNGHYYRLVSQGRNWTEAKQEAEWSTHAGLQGHLASVTSEAENDFIAGLGSVDGYWLGGFQAPGGSGPGENWQWITGEVFAYANWNSGEPNNAGDEDENALIYNSNEGQWNDLPKGEGAAGYVIEYDNEIIAVAAPTADPTPGTIAVGREVWLSTTTVGASIYYTTDGSDPSTAGTLYTGPIAVYEAVTIKAVAIKSGWTDSAIMTAAYTVADDAASVILDKEELQIGYSDYNSDRFVIGNVVLSSTGNYGSTISWASSDENTISTAGVVTRPGGADAAVTLTATISKGAYSDSKLFVLTVKKTAIEYQEFGGHYYAIVDKAINWADARAEAEAMVYNERHGHLATITDSNENLFITNLGYTYFHWLGGFQATGSGEPDLDWQWLTGEPWSYTNWNSGQPDNYEEEDLLHFNSEDGFWNDWHDSGIGLGYVVEFDEWGAPAAPCVAQSDPVSGGADVPISQPVKLTFNVDIAAGSDYDSIGMKDTANNPVAVAASISGRELRLIPAAGLKYETLYTVYIPAQAIKNLNDQHMAADYSLSFTTLDRWDFTAPEIIAVEPATGSTIGGDTAIRISVYYRDNDQADGASARFEASVDGNVWNTIGTAIGPNDDPKYGNKVFYSDWDLDSVNSGTYTVRCIVTDVSGNSGQESVIYQVDRTAPDAPQNLTVGFGSGGISLGWQSPPQADTAQYQIYRAVESGDFVLLGSVQGRDNTSYLDTDIRSGDTYHYYVVAIDHYNQTGSASNTADLAVDSDTTPPVVLGIAPSNNAVIAPQSTITVNASDNLLLSSITLQYAMSESGPWTNIETKSSTGTASFSWDSSPLSGSVFVRAIARDLPGNVSDGTPVRSYTIDGAGPEQVTGLKGAGSTTSIMLQWNDVSDQDFAYFQIESKPEVDGQYQSIGTTGAQLYWNATGLLPETAYWFRVVGYDVLGNRGTASDEVQVSTASDTEAPAVTGISPAPAAFATQISLQGSAGDNVGVSLFTFQYSLDHGAQWSDITSVTPAGFPASASVSYAWDVSALPEGIVTVRGVAADAAGNISSASPWVEYSIDHSPPEVPGGFTLTASTSQITLGWNQGDEADLAYYNVYRALDSDEGYVLLAGHHQSLSYYDTALESGRTYYYKISAVDGAGNESPACEPLSGALLPDTEAPQIVQIGPANGSRLPAHPTIGVLAQDNFTLTGITLEYQQAGDANWTPIGTQTASGASYVAYFSWDNSGLSDGEYTVRATAQDVAGNGSSPATAGYSLNVDPPAAPVLTATAGAWKVSLSWSSGNESDLAGFRLYRSTQAGGVYQMIGEFPAETASYSDEMLNPAHTYYYVIDALDNYSNRSRSNEAGATPDSTDIYNPAADAGDDQTGVVNTEIAFDGTASRDNHRIAGYSWDFGDGSTASSLAQPVHTYTMTGSYTVTLTVTDPAGNTSSDTSLVTIREADQVGTLKVKVLDDNGTALSGASIVLKFPDGSTQRLTSDGQGEAVWSLNPGAVQVHAYKNGYMPDSVNTEVVLNQTSIATISLVKGELVVGELTVHRMTLDEIIGAGIDVTAPENQNVYKFEVHLAFNNNPLPATTLMVNGAGNLVGAFNPIIIGSTGSGGSGGGGSGSTLIAYPAAIPYERPEVAPTIAYLVVPGEARWLKEFFEVGLALQNTAEAEYILSGSKATLNLPAGLALAPTAEAQTLQVDLGEIAGGESCEVKWIIRGDQKGEYNLSADFIGNLLPFNDAVQKTFTTSQPFRVWGDDAIKMHINTQERADQGYPYLARFGIENISTIPVYNAGLELKDKGKQNYIYAPNQELGQVVRELPAGETLWVDCYLIPAINGALDLTGSYVLNTGLSGTDVVTELSSLASSETARNYPGTAPVLRQSHNSDGTVTLAWDEVGEASGYRIYFIRDDLMISGEAELVYEAGAGETSVTLTETDGAKDYAMTTVIGGQEILRHAITGLSWCGNAGNAVITVDPIQVNVGSANQVLITVNRQGYPVDGGTVDVGSYVTGQALDGNGQATVSITPTMAEEITISAYDRNHNFLVSTTIQAVEKSSTISPTTAFFDKQAVTQTDLPVAVVFNGNTLDGVKNGTASLSAGIDYTVLGATVIIKKQYLAAQPLGTTNLTFDFSGGVDPVLAVKVVALDYFTLTGNPVTFKGATDSVVDSQGYLYVSDYYNNRVVKFNCANGSFMRAYGGTAAGSGIGQFNKLSGLAIDAADNIYVADTYNNRIVRFKDANNNGIEAGEWTAWGSAGSGVMQFNKPMGLYYKGGIVYVADTYNHRIVQFESSNPEGTWTAFGGSGAAAAQFKAPYDVVVDARNHLWVSDTLNNRVQEFDSSNQYVAQFTSQMPYGISVDNAGNVIVAERQTAQIKCINNPSTFGGKGAGAGAFTNPVGVNVDADNRLWIVDVTSGKVQVSLLP